MRKSRTPAAAVAITGFVPSSMRAVCFGHTPHEVSKELQAVCRPNPAKARSSCTKASKQRALAKATVAKACQDPLVEISSGSECEVVLLAMEQDSGPCFGRGWDATYCVV